MRAGGQIGDALADGIQFKHGGSLQEISRLF